MDANTKAIRGQVVAETMHSEIAYLNMFVQGQEVADAYIRFTSDEALPPNTLLVADALLSAMSLARQHELFQWRQGLLDEKVFLGKHHVTLTILACKNGQVWWKNEGSKFVSSEFANYVEHLYRNRTTENLDSWRRADGLGERE